MMSAKARDKINLIEDINENTIEEITFEKVDQINENEWSFYISGYELAELYDKEILGYFPDVQRGIKLKKVKCKGGEVTKKIPIRSDKNINEMKDNILNGIFFTSQLTFGVIKNGNESVEYDFNNKTLDIFKSSIFILDGYHRIMAVYKVYQYSKVVGNVDGIVDKLKSLMFPIRIVHYDIETCKLIFSQYAKGLKISTSKSESYDMSKSWNRIVDRLNKESVFADKIDSNKVTIAKSDEKNIVTFSTLTNSIKESFPIIQDKQEEQDIYDFLVLFFKELTDIFPEILDYELRTISKESSLICENVMFYGWLAIAEHLYLLRNKGGWQKKLKVLESINFNKDANTWSSIVRPGKNGANIINNKQTRSLLCKKIKEEFVLNQD